MNFRGTTPIQIESGIGADQKCQAMAAGPDLGGLGGLSRLTYGLQYRMGEVQRGSFCRVGCGW